MKERAQVLPLRFGDRTYKTIRAYLHRYPPPTGLGMRIRSDVLSLIVVSVCKKGEENTES